MKREATDRVKAADVVTKEWGGGNPARVPDWVMILAETVDAQGVRKTAERVGYSHSVISRVLNGKYDGDMERVAEIVKGAMLGATVMCPVSGEIARDVCLDNQRRGPPFTSSLRARLYRACRDGCPHFRGSKQSPPGDRPMSKPAVKSHK